MTRASEDELRHHKMMSRVKTQKPIIEHLYLHLDVIDAKVAVLLTFNSILIAIIAVFLSSDTQVIKGLKSELFWPFLIGSSGVALATALCLNTIEIIGSHSSAGKSLEEYVEYIAKIARTRTNCYRIALNITKLTCLLIFGILVFALVKT